MRVLVCGGRDYDEWLKVFDELEGLKPYPTTVIQGGASGADRHARDWAHDSGTECITFDADWSKHGKSAGPIRNQRMLDEGKPDLVLAFPGGKGTADMVGRAKAAGVRVIEVGP
jgi:hypothetical protein